MDEKKIHKKDYLILVILVSFLFLFLHFIIRDTEFDLLVRIPREYREAVNIEMQKYILAGNNPYSVNTLNKQIPGPFYVYPLLYCYVVVFFEIVTHIDLLTLNYIISFICIFFSGVIAFLVVDKITKCQWYSILAFILAINCHWRGGYVAAHPDDLSLFLLFVLIFIMQRENDKGKELIAAILALLLFFSKQYYIIIIPPLLLTFAAKSKKSSIRFCCCIILLFLLSAIFIYMKMPLYWMYAVCMLAGYEDYTTLDNLIYAFIQYKSFVILFICQFTPIVIYLFIWIKRRIKKKDKLIWNLKEMDQPLLYLGGDLFSDFIWISFWCIGISLLYFALNTGAFGTYFLQLWGPFVIILGAYTTISLMNRLERGKERAVKLVMTYLVVGINLFFIISKMDIVAINAQILEQWKSTYDLIDQQDGEIYYSPLLAFKGFEKGQYVYNTGLAPVMGIDDKTNPVALQFYPEYGALLNQQHLNIQNEMREKARNKEYSLITRAIGADKVFDDDLLTDYYFLKETRDLTSGNHTWSVEFWMPKE